MDITEAERLAREDVDHVIEIRGTHWHAGTIIVDGSALSPSWRALPGGARLWEAISGADARSRPLDEGVALQEAYEEALDRELDAVGYWEDGILFATGGVADFGSFEGKRPPACEATLGRWSHVA